MSNRKARIGNGRYGVIHVTPEMLEAMKSTKGAFIRLLELEEEYAKQPIPDWWEVVYVRFP